MNYQLLYVLCGIGIGLNLSIIARTLSQMLAEMRKGKIDRVIEHLGIDKAIKTASDEELRNLVNSLKEQKRDGRLTQQEMSKKAKG